MRFISYLYKDDVNKIINETSELNNEKVSVKDICISLKIPLVSNRFSYIILNLRNIEDIYGIFVTGNKDINKGLHKTLEIISESYIYTGELYNFKNKHKNLLNIKTCDIINRLNKSNNLIKYNDLYKNFTDISLYMISQYMNIYMYL